MQKVSHRSDHGPAIELNMEKLKKAIVKEYRKEDRKRRDLLNWWLELCNHKGD